MVKEKNADKVIFDNLLRPVQAYNLAKATGVEATDRFELILEIFTQRATTTEAQLQIQLAKLQRDLAQAKEKVRLAKKGEQPGFSGLGAYEVDIYHEAVKKQVHTVRKKLKKIRAKRELQRTHRAKLDFQSISLAGYTSAGKSSLFNALTEADVRVDSVLFTTLSTTTRLIDIEGKKFMLTDTVGFIDRLPLTLIEAFHSTLEETIYSDLILLVVDTSEPMHVINKKLSVCLETIEQIDASGIPTITVLNKIDKIDQTEVNHRTEQLQNMATNIVTVSALYRTNLDSLKKEVLNTLQNYVKATFTIPLKNETMTFISWLYKNANVEKLAYTGNSAEVIFEAPPAVAEKVRSRVQQMNGQFHKT